MCKELEGRWLELFGDVELTFEIVHLESQDIHLFSRTRDGQSAVTGRLKAAEEAEAGAGAAWTAQLSDGGGLVLKWADGQHGSVLLREETRGADDVERGEARRMVDSEAWRAVVQQAVGPGETMKIQAAPGSGKTTALREWCRGHADKRILFLSFSKAVQQQQERNFGELANVCVRTLHSVAYEATRAFDLKVGELSKTAVKDACRVGWDEAETIQQRLQEFLTSSAPLDSSPKPVRKLWARMMEGELQISHDGYLKAFQLSMLNQPEKLNHVFQGYDALVLDEAQDCTAAMLDIFRRAPSMAKVLAFDRHQNISHFRGVTNSNELADMPATHVRSLPQSFRFGPEVATLLTQFIRLRKEMPGFEVVGDPGKATAVSRVTCPRDAYKAALADGGKLTVLARKNSTLFSEIANVVSASSKISPCGQELRLFFVGGWRSYLEQVLDPVMDLHHLGRREYSKIKSQFVRRYQTLDKLRFVVDSQKMVDWIVKLEIYDSSNGNFPALQKKIADAVADNETEARILFSTVHKAKGLGWPSVLLLNDFLKTPRGSSHVPEEEVNICYVGLSRVSTGTLYHTFDPVPLQSNFQPLRQTRWQDFDDGFYGDMMEEDMESEEFYGDEDEAYQDESDECPSGFDEEEEEEEPQQQDDHEDSEGDKENGEPPGAENSREDSEPPSKRPRS